MCPQKRPSGGRFTFVLASRDLDATKVMSPSDWLAQRTWFSQAGRLLHRKKAHWRTRQRGCWRREGASFRSTRRKRVMSSRATGVPEPKPLLLLLLLASHQTPPSPREKVLISRRTTCSHASVWPLLKSIPPSHPDVFHPVFRTTIFKPPTCIAPQIIRALSVREWRRIMPITTRTPAALSGGTHVAGAHRNR